MLLFIKFRGCLIFTRNWLRLYSILIWAPELYVSDPQSLRSSLPACSKYRLQMSKWKKKRIMIIYVLHFMLLYIPKTTFTPTLYNSQDTHITELLEGRLRNIKVIYSRSQSPKQQNCPQVMFLTLWRGSGYVPQCQGQPRAVRWTWSLPECRFGAPHRTWITFSSDGGLELESVFFKHHGPAHFCVW